MNLIPKRGMKFVHKRLIGDEVCVVSRVADGVVYYKVGDERKAKNYIPVKDFHKYVARVIEG